MKRIFQFLCLAIAAIGLSSCTTYVDQPGYVSSGYVRPAYVSGYGYGYRSAPRHGHGPYYGSSRNVSYRNSSYHSHSPRTARYDGRILRNNPRHAVNTRVRTPVFN